MSVTAEREGRVASRQITVDFIRDVARILSEGAEKYVTQESSKLGSQPPSPDSKEDFKGAQEKREKLWSWESRRKELATLTKASVSIETSDGDHVYYNETNLQNIRFPSKMKELSIAVGTEYGEFGASVKIVFHVSIMGYEGSTYRIRGHDKHTVLGLEATLRQKLSEERSLGDILYQEKSLVAIDVIVATLNSWVLWVLLSFLNPTKPDLGWVPLVWLASLYIMPWSLRWLFPPFTYAEDSRNSIRRALKTLFSLGYGALNLFGLFIQLTGYSLHVTSTQTITTTLTTVTTLTTTPAIPGFVSESIIIGLLMGFAIIISLRRSRKRSGVEKA